MYILYICRFGVGRIARIFDRRTVNVCKQEFRCKYTRLVCQSEGLMNAHKLYTRARALCSQRTVERVRDGRGGAREGAGVAFDSLDLSVPESRVLRYII